MNTKNQKPGCLGFLFRIFGGAGHEGGSASKSEQLPYRQRDDFLSPAELSFFLVMRHAVGQELHICAKVRISDLLYVVKPNENRGHRNRINQKHVDFVLCAPKTMRPQLVVELDDKSHQRKDRIDRDKLVDSAFAAAGLPILHVPAKAAYSVDALREQISAKLSGQASPSKTVEQPPVTAEPQCPKCETAMVQRTASKGKNKGKRFWACTSYPACRQIIPID